MLNRYATRFVPLTPLVPAATTFTSPDDACPATTGALLHGNIARHLRFHPAVLPGSTSAINYSAGQTRTNNAIIALDDQGRIAVFCGQATGTVDFILDVSGYFE